MNEETNEHGLKTAAGMMLSKHLRQVGLEKTECSDMDPESGNPRMMTKAEALARAIWKLALGFKEEVRSTNAKGQTKLTIKVHEPNATFVAMLLDRIEGKVATDKDSAAKKQPISSKVDDQAKKRLNAMAGDNDET